MAAGTGEGWTVEVLVQGYPGKSRHNGGLGWSSVALARGPGGRVAVLDTGSFSLRRTLVARLAARGLAPSDVTDLLLTHTHYDHCLNWPLFPEATIHVGVAELAWALGRPADDPLVPDWTVRALADSPRLRTIATDGAEPLPGVEAIETPGHTPHHLAFRLRGESQDVIFAGDAAKNLAELTTGEADLTMDAGASARSIRRLAEAWRSRAGTLMIPGHDLTLAIGEDGVPRRLGRWEAGISAVFGTSPKDATVFGLGDPAHAGAV